MQDKPNKNLRRGAGRVSFIARIEKFRELIKAGHGQRTIYDEFGGKEKLGISYSQFNRYMTRYIVGKKEKQGGDGLQKNDLQQFDQVSQYQAPIINTQYEAQNHNEKTEKYSSKQHNGFQHNPNSSDRDDLI
ncbi:MAG: TraK family protein [Gammaproteobacteria bacterium]